MLSFIAKFLVVFWSAEFCYGKSAMENENMFQGDIKLTKAQMKAMKNGDRLGYAGFTILNWPKDIAYQISPELFKEPRAVYAIDQAVADYNRYTCLRFKRRTTETDFMYFIKDTGCYASYGFLGGRSTISLGDGCWTKGTAIHEIAHALGVIHEHSRYDRDSYVHVNWTNIIPKNQGNFLIQPFADTFGYPYDYDSVMHYGEYFFSKNTLKTLETLHPANSHRIGQNYGFSHLDVKKMNKLYNCQPATNPPTTAPLQPQTNGKTNSITSMPPNTRPITQKNTRSSATLINQHTTKGTNGGITWPPFSFAPITVPNTATTGPIPTTSGHKTTIYCEGDLQFFACPTGNIKIIHGMFDYSFGEGEEAFRRHCNPPSDPPPRVHCRSKTSSETIGKQCNGRRSCIVDVNRIVLGNPTATYPLYPNCGNVRNYLYLEFICV